MPEQIQVDGPTPAAIPSAHGRSRNFVEALGDFALFSGSALLGVLRVGRSTSDLLRQAAILITGSTVACMILVFVVGGETALFGDYFLRAAGASEYVGFFTGLTVNRFILPVFFGYIFAAKVGCGFVAELGSMRINEEIDAYESVGVDPMRFVIATRLAGTALFVTVIYPLLALATTLGVALTVLFQLESVSLGGFQDTHWALQALGDYAFSFIALFAISMCITLVACWYGYRVRGGPVEVGVATSRSMVANLLLIHVLYAALVTAWFGINPTMPIGG